MTDEHQDIILKADGKSVGIFSRKPKIIPVDETPPKITLPLTDQQKVKKIAHRIVTSTVKVTEEQALAQALEHKMAAEHRMSLKRPLPKRSIGREALLWFAEHFTKK